MGNCGSGSGVDETALSWKPTCKEDVDTFLRVRKTFRYFPRKFKLKKDVIDHALRACKLDRNTEFEPENTAHLATHLLPEVRNAVEKLADYILVKRGGIPENVIQYLKWETLRCLPKRFEAETQDTHHLHHLSGDKDGWHIPDASTIRAGISKGLMSFLEERFDMLWGSKFPQPWQMRRIVSTMYISSATGGESANASATSRKGRARLPAEKMRQLQEQIKEAQREAGVPSGRRSSDHSTSTTVTQTTAPASSQPSEQSLQTSAIPTLLSESNFADISRESVSDNDSQDSSCSALSDVLTRLNGTETERTIGSPVSSQRPSTTTLSTGPADADMADIHAHLHAEPTITDATLTPRSFMSFGSIPDSGGAGTAMYQHVASPATAPRRRLSSQTDRLALAALNAQLSVAESGSITPTSDDIAERFVVAPLDPGEPDDVADQAVHPKYAVFAIPMIASLDMTPRGPIVASGVQSPTSVPSSASGKQLLAGKKKPLTSNRRSSKPSTASASKRFFTPPTQQSPVTRAVTRRSTPEATFSSISPSVQTIPASNRTARAQTKTPTSRRPSVRDLM
eukprot:TRINITY_DN162_c0_g1_i1.p1 TRINITY_DN162_c0_g1~~TRINITY_DN162_c0_g1_i1.p1  ORF type:complete len:593 (+),score=76.15 TRINITY_DN162_c0_g1_i1:75-1781(+)